MHTYTAQHRDMQASAYWKQSSLASIVLYLCQPAQGEGLVNLDQGECSASII